MSFHHHLLAGAYYPLKALNVIGRQVGISSPDQLRVLLYHDIAPVDQANFAAQMRWLKQSWNFVGVKRFEAMISGEEPVRGRNLLLTFDDGFLSNRAVAQDVLNPMGIEAVFFVVSELVGTKSRLEAREFIARNVCPGTKSEQLPPHWSSMDWKDLEALLEQGHCIGSHTSTHARLSIVAAEDALQKEIVHGARHLEVRLGTPVDHFSYTFGDLDSFSQPAFEIARKRFRFIYSGLRGDNANGASPFAIRRDSVAGQDAHSNYSIFSNRLVGALLEGAADTRYKGSLATLDKWALRE
jgi:peptidoglycan/xylan/chitin deacetylase (PgdA/CDA1 family)